MAFTYFHWLTRGAFNKRATRGNFFRTDEQLQSYQSHMPIQNETRTADDGHWASEDSLMVQDTAFLQKQLYNFLNTGQPMSVASFFHMLQEHPPHTACEAHHQLDPAIQQEGRGR
jgi:hypothetical protein